MRCVDCGYTSDCFDASVVGIKEGAFTLQSKCPECGSAKVLFNAGEFEEQLRILIAKKGEAVSISTEMANQNRHFLILHLREALVGAIAEIDGNETLSRRLHAQAKLRLITMSDEEQQELAKLVACPPERPVEMVYRGLKSDIEELKETATEWMKDLQRNTTADPEEEMRDRVLIVENEPSLREELVSVFKLAGFAVSDASDYSQALQRLYEFKVNLIVMESILPDWDGFEASYEFRNRFSIPVILLGQDSGGQVWKRVMEADADHYEVKPCKYLALAARAKAILRRHKSTTSRSSDDSGRRKES